GIACLAIVGLAAGCREASSREVLRSGAPAELFRDIAKEVGVSFHYFNGATGQYLFPEITGGGAALIDYDNDGDLDLYVVQSTLLNPQKKLWEAVIPLPQGWTPGNRLYKNLLAETGKLQFVDVTDQAGVGYIGFGMGAAAGDFDNDGYADLYVTNY